MTTPTAVQPSAASIRAAPRTPPAAPATLVLIASAGHSGSTLLDVLLANHPYVSRAGEMNCLNLHAADRVCACGATVTSCGHWITMLFNRAQRAIVHDERWRRDLAAADLEAFDRLAGKLNRSFEYR